MKTMLSNEVWDNKWTFILVAAGSAVGLGNIWKFPYIVGENGGGAFFFVYLFCVFLIGVPILISEVLMGKRGRENPIDSVMKLTDESNSKRIWKSIGWLGVFSGFLIMCLYSVVASWSLHYTYISLTGDLLNENPQTIRNQLDDLLASPSLIFIWHSIFSGITFLVVSLGVQKGLSSVAKYMMPFLFLSLFILLIFSAMNGDFQAASSFLFTVNFDELTWSGSLKALGHAFFTLSIATGSMMVYGSYMPQHASITQTVLYIAIIDTLVAVIAGLVVFSIVFSEPSLKASSGPALLFISLPIAFINMPYGEIFSPIFFLLVSVAALSSSVSLIEPSVAWVTKKFKMNRPLATLLVSGLTWIIGISCVLSFNLWEDLTPFFLLYMNPFDFLDFVTSMVFLPVGGLMIALFVGWSMKKNIVMSELQFNREILSKLWLMLVRYISPLLILIVLFVPLYDFFSN